jgi:hypothetical protein
MSLTLSKIFLNKQLKKYNFIEQMKLSKLNEEIIIDIWEM